MLWLPPPINHWRKTWCYDGGAAYYRLGYIVPEHFTYPGELEVRVFTSLGKLPDQEMPCWTELKALKEKYP
jgi:hypothetical protein